VVSVHNELVNAVDAGHVGSLVMLDLSSAFDTVDHDVMFNVLSARFGIRDNGFILIFPIVAKSSASVRAHLGPSY